MAILFFIIAGFNAFAASVGVSAGIASVLYSLNVGFCVACFGLGIYFAVRD